MQSVGRIYGAKGNGRVSKVLIAAKLAGVNVDFDPSFKFGVDNRTFEYLTKFPLGQTPAFEGRDGLILTESNAIVYCLASLGIGQKLLGKDARTEAQITQYSFYAETQVAPFGVSILLPIIGFAPYIKAVEENSYKSLDRALDYLEKQLAGKKFLVGDEVSVADIIVVADLLTPFQMFIDTEHRARFPNVSRYVDNFANLPEVKEIVGTIKLNEKRPKLDKTDSTSLDQSDEPSKEDLLDDKTMQTASSESQEKTTKCSNQAKKSFKTFLAKINIFKNRA